MKITRQPERTWKKTEETSNLESEDDSRKRKLPTRLISESESGTDIDSDIEDKKKTSLISV